MYLSKANGFYCVYAKRFIDIFCSVLVILCFWWLYLFLAILVRYNLGSPVIFKQDRPGLIDKSTGKETIFKLCKFRSMSNAVDENGNLRPDAERLTKFGKWLRASSLDELPEIWNILIGDMSLIGPRPWAVSYLKYFTPREHCRHLVRPGLSGWAQVNGRTAATWDDRLRYDLEYVENISFWFDIKTILTTIKVVLCRSDIVEAGQQGDFSTYREKQWADGTVPRPENDC